MECAQNDPFAKGWKVIGEYYAKKYGVRLVDPRVVFVEGDEASPEKPEQSE